MASIEHPEITVFLKYFHSTVASKNVAETLFIYETTFPRFTERYYKSTSWPSIDAVREAIPEVEDIFLILYRELYYRHMYSKLQSEVTMEHRLASWNNYIDLFEFFNSADEDRPEEWLALPNQWLWDMVSEFIYQYRQLCNFRSKLKNKSEDEIEFLRANPTMWSAPGVLEHLYLLVDKSGFERDDITAR